MGRLLDVLWWLQAKAAVVLGLPAALGGRLYSLWWSGRPK